MTVKCLSQIDKQFIVLNYRTGSSIKRIASDMDVSTRTVNRVLDEMGVCKLTQQSEMKTVKEILIRYSVSAKELENFLKNNHVSKNYQRSVRKEKQIPALFMPIQ